MWLRRVINSESTNKNTTKMALVIWYNRDNDNYSDNNDNNNDDNNN